ncbi:uncharacterized protein LOC115213919 isoform X1, partial [Argonauta hians]
MDFVSPHYIGGKNCVVVESQRPLALKPVPQYSPSKKLSGKQRVISKAPEAKRMSNSKVIHSGWLGIQESSGLRSWKQRWCVHVDYGLFFYKDASEQHCVSSILLPSYTIRPCDASDSINKRYAFKAEHANMKTQYFVADSVESMDQWIRVLNQSALMITNNIEMQDNNTRLNQPFQSQTSAADYDGSITKSESLPEYYPPENPVESLCNGRHSSNDADTSEYTMPYLYSPNNSAPSNRSSYTQEEGIPSEQLRNRSPHSSAGSHGISGDYGDRIPQPQPTNYLPNAPHSRASISSSTYQYSNRPPEQFSRDDESYSSSLRLNSSQNNYIPGTLYTEDPHYSPISLKSISNNSNNNNDDNNNNNNYNNDDNNNINIYRSLEFITPDSQINNGFSYSDKDLPHSPSHSQILTDSTYPKEINYAVIQRHSNEGSLSPPVESHNGFPYSNNNSPFTQTLNSPQNSVVGEEQNLMPLNNTVGRYSKDMYGAQTDLSNLSLESDFDYRTSKQISSPEYATIQRRSTGNIGELYRTNSAINDRPNSISVPYRANSISVPSRHSVSDMPKQTSLQLLQNMHMNELRKHPSFSKTFPKDYSPNYQNISQTFSQYSDDDEQFDTVSYKESLNYNEDKLKQPSSNIPHKQYMSSIDPENTIDLVSLDNGTNNILYDYKGTSHNTSFPTRSFQELSVKPPEHSNDFEFGETNPPVSEYVNITARQSFADSSSHSELDRILPKSSPVSFQDYNYGRYSPAQSKHSEVHSPVLHNTTDAGSIPSPSMHLEKKENYINYQQPVLQSEHVIPVYKRNHRVQRNMSTVKEDPNMPDEEVIKTNRPVISKLKNNTARLRMSISADDLLGKTHEELVLLLIQLRRNKANFEKIRISLRQKLDSLRPFEHEYKQQIAEHNRVLDYSIEDKHGHYMELKKQCDEVENKLEMYKPIENLVDNMVTMGSLYGGNNYMLATQYRKHLLHPDEYIPPKNMIEFSRRHEEEQIFQQIEKDIQELTQDEADLEEKMDRLYLLDRLIQENSLAVTSLKSDKESLEGTLRGVLKEMSEPNDPQQLEHFHHKEQNIQKELSRTMQQLAESSKELEELNAESSKLEHEIALLRSKVHGDLNRSRTAATLSGDSSHTRYQIEKDLHRVQDVMHNLNKEGVRLSEALNTLKSPVTIEEDVNKTVKQATTYYETDIDTKITVDLALHHNSAAADDVEHVNSKFPEGRPDYVEYPQPNAVNLTERLNSPFEQNLVTDPIYVSQETPLLVEPQMKPGYPKPYYEGYGGIPDSELLSVDRTDDPSDPRNNWSIEDADDNTKRFFGLLPKDRPRVQTVRDVKRQAEQRRERVGGSDKSKSYAEEEMNREAEIAASDVRVKVSPRGRSRYLTISSSEPIKLEHALEQKSSLNSAAGDLIISSSLINNMPDIIQSSTLDKFDELTIDRELMMPEKVSIPERYMPDSDEEDISEEEKEKRREKSERIRKVLAEQSVSSWAKTNPEEMKDGLHEYIAKEKQNREKLLTITQELAMEVTRKSKAAAVERRKTWSGTSSFDYLSSMKTRPSIMNDQYMDDS